MALLGKIVDVQRKIIAEEMNPDVTKVPQLWCLYKEVQDFYNAGMRVPDDVTLLWAEDNWGNVRRLPTAEERKRAGGAGVYYHFDYHGGPRSYQWINTSPIAKIWDQMSLAKQYGADRIWIVNVGHFKGYEFSARIFHAPGLGHGPMDQRQHSTNSPGCGRSGNSGRRMPETSPTSLPNTPNTTAAANPSCSSRTPTAWSIIRRRKTWWRTSKPSPPKRRRYMASCPKPNGTLSTNWCCSPPRPARW